MPGTNLKFLICCNTAPEFYSLIVKTKQFTDLTGITVEWGSNAVREPSRMNHEGRRGEVTPPMT